MGINGKGGLILKEKGGAGLKQEKKPKPKRDEVRISKRQDEVDLEKKIQRGL